MSRRSPCRWPLVNNTPCGRWSPSADCDRRATDTERPYCSICQLTVMNDLRLVIHRRSHFLPAFTTALLCMAIMGALFTATTASQSSPRRHLVIVLDGLRPDYVTPEAMPNLTALGR